MSVWKRIDSIWWMNEWMNEWAMANAYIFFERMHPLLSSDNAMQKNSVLHKVIKDFSTNSCLCHGYEHTLSYTERTQHNYLFLNALISNAQHPNFDWASCAVWLQCNCIIVVFPHFKNVDWLACPLCNICIPFQHISHTHNQDKMKKSFRIVAHRFSLLNYILENGNISSVAIATWLYYHLNID